MQDRPETRLRMGLLEPFDTETGRYVGVLHLDGEPVLRVERRYDFGSPWGEGQISQAGGLTAEEGLARIRGFCEAIGTVAWAGEERVAEWSPEQVADEYALHAWSGRPPPGMRYRLRGRDDIPQAGAYVVARDRYASDGIAEEPTPRYVVFPCPDLETALALERALYADMAGAAWADWAEISVGSERPDLADGRIWSVAPRGEVDDWLEPARERARDGRDLDLGG